jgi:hypothetical protein
VFLFRTLRVSRHYAELHVAGQRAAGGGHGDKAGSRSGENNGPQKPVAQDLNVAGVPLNETAVVPVNP